MALNSHYFLGAKGVAYASQSLDDRQGHPVHTNSSDSLKFGTLLVSKRQIGSELTS